MAGELANVKFYSAAVRDLLQGTHGPVAMDVARRAERVASQARINASGPPHGYYRGRTYPSSRGSEGPGVRSGLGRAGIGFVMGLDARGVYADVGSTVKYMGYLELSGRYPWLLRALPYAVD